MARWVIFVFSLIILFLLPRTNPLFFLFHARIRTSANDSFLVSWFFFVHNATSIYRIYIHMCPIYPCMHVYMYYIYPSREYRERLVLTTSFYAQALTVTHNHSISILFDFYPPITFVSYYRPTPTLLLIVFPSSFVHLLSSSTLINKSSMKRYFVIACYCDSRRVVQLSRSSEQRRTKKKTRCHFEMISFYGPFFFPLF